MKDLSRRDFLKAAAGGAGALVLGAAPTGAPAAEGPLVSLARGGEVRDLVRKAVGALGGMKAHVKAGETVIVKPNIGWDRTPEQGANTHPELVAEVVRMCLEAGAAKVKVFDRTCNDARRCYVNSGIAPALERIGDERLEVSFIDERRFRDLEIPGATKLKRWPFYEEVLRADRLINLPVLKHHSATVLTIGMKNVMGVAGNNRAVLHRGIHEILLDLNRAVRSHLTIVDATRALVANGPQGGRLEDVRILDTVVAGTDVVAVDTVAASLLGRTPREVRYLQLAHEQGLGVADLAGIRVSRVGG